MRVDMAGKVSSALTMVATGGAILLDQAWVDVLMWVGGGRSRSARFANYSRIAVARAAGAEPRPAPEG